MRSARHSLIAAVTLAVSTGLALAFESVMHIGRPSLTLYLPAVLIVTALSGRTWGLVVTLASPLIAELVIPHAHVGSRTSAGELASLTIFGTIGIGCAVLAERLERARRQAELAAADARKRAEELTTAHEQLTVLRRAAEQRARDFTTLFEETPIGIGIAEDVDCTRIIPNRTLAEMLGVAEGTNISQDADPAIRVPLTFAATDGTPLTKDELPIEQAARTGRAVRGVDLDIIRGDGTRLSLLEFAAPLLDEQGRTRGAIGAFLDVSRRRRAAEEQRFIAEATHLLSGSLEPERTLARLVRLAVPQVADHSLLDILDEHGEVTRAGLAHRDPAVERTLIDPLLRTPPGQGLRRPRGLLDLVPDGRPRLVPVVTEARLAEVGFSPPQVALAAGLGVRSLLLTPIVLKGRVIGAFSWSRLAGRPSFDEQDVALATVVAERVAAAVENGRLYREAQTASRLKDEFVATLSHELRTPLNALLGWIELVRSGRLTPERERQALDAIERTARMQSKITNDLVDVSQAASGKFRLAPREVDAGEIVRTCADAFRPAAESKGLTLTVALGPDLPPIAVDPDRFQQIVFNLVANAVKFTATGRVDVMARVEPGWLEVAVRDTGIGIAPEFLPYVFDRFRQADGSATRTFGGLGLGLSIVRSLVELHGGMVAAQSDGAGHGATFTVWIPMSPASGARPAAAPTLAGADAR